MNTINEFISILEILLYVVFFIFIPTTAYLIFAVKKINYSLIKSAVKNPLLPNIDLNFFNSVRSEYLSHNKDSFIPLINKISSRTMVIIFAMLFLLTIIHDFIRYT